MRNLRNSQGFTLIELMIVVVIIGILAAIAIPKFSSVSKGAKEAEAEPILKQMRSLQESFFLKNDTYASTLPADGAVLVATDLAGWTDPQADYYTFSIGAGGECLVATPIDAAVVGPKSMDLDSGEIYNTLTCS